MGIREFWNTRKATGSHLESASFVPVSQELYQKLMDEYDQLRELGFKQEGSSPFRTYSISKQDGTQIDLYINFFDVQAKIRNGDRNNDLDLVGEILGEIDRQDGAFSELSEEFRLQIKATFTALDEYVKGVIQNEDGLEKRKANKPGAPVIGQDYVTRFVSFGTRLNHIYEYSFHDHLDVFARIFDSDDQYPTCVLDGTFPPDVLEMMKTPEDIPDGVLKRPPSGHATIMAGPTQHSSPTGPDHLTRHAVVVDVAPRGMSPDLKQAIELFR